MKITQVGEEVVIEVESLRATYSRKLWFELYNNVVQPIKHGEKPRYSTVLLYGRPGSGKTLLIKILARLVKVVEVREHDFIKFLLREDIVFTTDVLNAVKKVEDFFYRIARENEPCIVAVDDAEFLDTHPVTRLGLLHFITKLSTSSIKSTLLLATNYEKFYNNIKHVVDKVLVTQQ